MSAIKYRICCAFTEAYIAMVDSRNPNLMTNDRRPISEEEILTLIDWYLDNRLGDKYTIIKFNSHQRQGLKVQMQFEEEGGENG